MIDKQTVPLNKLTEIKLDIPEEEFQKIHEQISKAMIQHIEYSLFTWPFRKQELISDWLKNYTYKIPADYDLEKPIKFEVTTKYGTSIE